MRKVAKKELRRLLDANLNRAREGLRVCEDIARFYADNRTLVKSFKNIRQQLTEIAKEFGIKQIIQSRNIVSDVGKSSTDLELRRKNISDVFYANTQRAKESIRVLEEVSKLHGMKMAQKYKSLRYRLYEVERLAAEINFEDKS